MTYDQLFDQCVDANELARREQENVDRVGIVAARAIREIELAREAGKITGAQRAVLYSIIKENVVAGG